MKSAVDTTVMTLQSNIPLARIGKNPTLLSTMFTSRVRVSSEFLDEMQVRACNKYSNLTLKETPTLFLEFHGSEAATVEQAKEVGEEKTATP